MGDQGWANVEKISKNLTICNSKFLKFLFVMNVFPSIFGLYLVEPCAIPQLISVNHKQIILIYPCVCPLVYFLCAVYEMVDYNCGLMT